MGTLRIIAGQARGRNLVTPMGRTVRPTAQRVRQAVFDVLGQFFQGERVLDLYAGSGAMGIEALSRGAGFATFVEVDPAALRAIQSNLRHVGWEDRARVVRQDALHFLRGARGADYDLVFVDPPYRDSPAAALEALGALGLGEGARVVVEHDAGFAPRERYGNLRMEDARRYGGTHVTIFGAGSEESP